MINKKGISLHPQSSNNDGAIAQLVEQRTENPCVPGSIPGGTTPPFISPVRLSVRVFLLYTPHLIIYSKIKLARFSQTQIFNEKQLQHVTINIDIMGSRNLMGVSVELCDSKEKKRGSRNFGSTKQIVNI